MNKRNLYIIILCALTISVVFASQSLAFTLCLDDPTGCNDIKLIYSGNAEGGVYSVIGYEYGCGYYNKEIYGTLRVKNGLYYLNITKNGVYGDQAMTSPEVIVYNPAKGTGTYNRIVIYSDESWDVSGKYKKVWCTAAESQVVAESAADSDRDARK